MPRSQLAALEQTSTNFEAPLPSAPRRATSRWQVATTWISACAPAAWGVWAALQQTAALLDLR